MQTQEVAIKPTMKVFMKVDSEMLDEVIVVAYGTAKKSAFTGSASVVKADKLEKRQVSNITNALSGSVAGVQTTSRTANQELQPQYVFVVLVLWHPAAIRYT